jgi:hypothetical protein
MHSNDECTIIKNKDMMHAIHSVNHAKSTPSEDLLATVRLNLYSKVATSSRIED